MYDFLFGNNLDTILTSDIDENATVIEILSGNEGFFPNIEKENQVFAITLSEGNNNQNTEICFVISKKNNKFTVIRGQENTTARKWSQGTTISNRITAEPLNQIKDKLNKSDMDWLSKDFMNKFYKKSGDQLTGAMETTGQKIFDNGKKSYLVGNNGVWSFKNADDQKILTITNDSVQLGTQYSSFTGNIFNLINGATHFQFKGGMECNGTLIVKGKDIIIDRGDRDYINDQLNLPSILWRFNQNDIINFYATHNRSKDGYQLHLAIKGSEKLTVSENGTTNVDKLEANAVKTNQQSIYGNIDIYCPTNNDTGINVGSLVNYHVRSYRAWTNVEEIIGKEINYVIAVQGAKDPSYLRFSEYGKLTCNSIQTNTINTDSLDVSENINAKTIEVSENIHTNSLSVSESINTKTIDASGTVTVNDNVLNINSSNKDMNENGLIVANASIHFNLVNRIRQTGGIYIQEDFKNNKTDLVFYVGNSFYTMDDQGTLTGKNFNGVSMSAFCADLAEYYIADEKYDPGTLVKIGGEKEITKASIGGFFYGIISTSPAYEMNTAIRDEKNALPVALAGRIPVLMTGMIDKGDPVTISEISGVARKAGEGEKYIGFSLENSHETSIRLVECVIKQN